MNGGAIPPSGKTSEGRAFPPEVKANSPLAQQLSSEGPQLNLAIAHYSLFVWLIPTEFSLGRFSRRASHDPF